jgi:SAM-dependent methyltransferase
MDRHAAATPRLFSTHSEHIFKDNVDDRERLEDQFGLLREDFTLWFDETLRLGGLSTDPDRATWSVLDVGCGEGQYTREIARRYPKARVVGVDADADAISTAAELSQSDSVEFLVGDAGEPLTQRLGAAAFDVAMVNVCGLMDGAEFDRLLRRLAAESVLRLSGEVRFLATLARRT